MQRILGAFLTSSDPTWLPSSVHGSYSVRGNPRQRSGSALCVSDALMSFFCLSIYTQQEHMIHSCVTIKAGIHYTNTVHVML